MKTTAIILFFAATLLSQAHAAEITAIPEGCSGPCVYLNGEIKSGDLIKLKAVFESPTRSRYFLPSFTPPIEIFILQLNSRGGSLEEAMAIGRWARNNRIVTSMQREMECFSSCVYILAAGVAKQWIGTIFGNRVGIHRPYLTQMPKEGVQIAMNRALADSKRYFSEMNIPDQLADAMFSIPPDNVEILTDDKLSFYRLNQYDMAFEEELQLKAAALYGMTRQQYMQNTELMMKESQKCLDRSSAQLDRKLEQIERKPGVKREEESFDGTKCLEDTRKKYGLHESQRFQRR